MQKKQRHGCVTALLIIIIFINSISTILYLFASEVIAKNYPYGISTVFVILSICNVIFSILLFNWASFGFWGFVITSSAIFLVNLNIGVGIGRSLLGLAMIAILYGVLQIKENGVTGWDHLE